MGNKREISLRKIISISQTEYVKWICNPRIIIFFCLIIFVYDYIILEMKDAAGELGTHCMALEPFLAIGNSTLLILLVPVVFITLLGDFPKTDGNTMFYICRTGKKNWIFGQLLFAFMAETTYLVAILVFSILFALPFSDWTFKWSDVTTKYAYYFPEKTGSLVANLLTNRLYNNLTPLQTFGYTCSLLLLYLLLISAIMLTGFALGKRIMGMVINCVLMCVGTAFSLTGSMIKWYFPAANTVSWMHFDHYMKTQIFDVRNSYLYFLILIIILVAVDIKAIHRYDFAKITDMED
ncbi:MAG: hypothetical protein K2I03_04080 [Lachnospiraceae bacterium]|nr:hypothetical protein [Lachnospiraceae bacterium]MDE6253525.1 hypothetical protein [Lachnospiraceae bacterium]